MIPAWIRSLLGRSSPARKPVRSRRTSVRPSFQALEERWTPATHSVGVPTEANLITAINAALADADPNIVVDFDQPGSIDITGLHVDTTANGDSFYLLTYATGKNLSFTTSGGPVTLNRNSANLFRFFEVSTGLNDLSFTGVTMTNGAADANFNGGAILFGSGTGTYHVTGGTFSGNVTSGTGNGGAFYVEAGEITFADATITSNQANGSGKGGSIYLNTPTAGLENTTVSNSTATSDGGGIYSADAMLFLDADSDVTNNTSSASGGGIAIADGEVTITGSTISANDANAATGAGGGISITGGTLNLDGATIGLTGMGNANTAARGGGIAVDNAATISFLTNTTNVQFNSATTSGGGIDFGTSFSSTLAFDGNLNVASNTTTANGSLGGGIAVRGGGSVTLSGATVVSNQANGGVNSRGGGVAVSAGTFVLSAGSIIGSSTLGSGNQSTGNGGGIAVSGTGAATIRGTIVGNSVPTATGAGGGAFISAGTLTFDGAAVGGAGADDKNQAATGGGLATTGGAINFSTNTSTFRGNTAVQFGGGIDAVGGTFTSTAGVVIAANLVDGMSSHGGGLAVRGATVQLVDAAISGNFANAIGGSGGGIYQDAGSLGLINTTIGASGLFGRNEAQVNGGGAEIVGGSFSLSTNSGTSAVNGNRANNGHGGGLFIGGLSVISITGTSNFPVLFNGNTANSTLGGSGGAIMIDATMANTFTIEQARFGLTTKNSALRGGAIAKFNGAADGTGPGLLINDSQFRLNSADGLNVATDGGGGILVAGGTVTSDPSVYDGMVSATNGGAINVLAGTLVIGAGDEFTNNSAALNGGAINYSGGTSHTINSLAGDPVLIANNSAGNLGGGINVDVADVAGIELAISTTIIGGVPTAPPMTPTPGQSTFAALRGNTAASGGGINVVRGQVTLGLSTVGGTVADVNTVLDQISGNIASTGNGGGINVTGGSIVVTSTTIGSTVADASGNRALMGSGGGINVAGGAVTIDGGRIGSDVNLTRGNRANLNGGGIEWSAGTLTFLGATEVRFNSTTLGFGGGLDIAAPIALTINTGTTFLDNRARGAVNGSGGGIAHRGGNVLNLTATIEGNLADVDGGGVFLSGSTLNVIGSTIGSPNAGNTATNSGGGIAVASGALAVSAATTIEDNTATNGSGGGINVASATAFSVADATISSNNAGTSGGGIHFTAANAASVTNSILASNFAGTDGGGINLASTFAVTLQLNGVTIGGASLAEGNTATNDGGGINVDGGNLTVSTTSAATVVANVIDFNTATTGDGGGINVGTAGVVTFAGTANNAAGNTVTNSISSNRALAGDGGGIFLFSGTLNLNGSSNFDGTIPPPPVNIVINVVSNNVASGSGGGLNQVAGTFAADVATFDNNTAQNGDGGGLNFVGGNAGTMALPIRQITISNNHAEVSGAGVANAATTLFLNNCTISGNVLDGVTGDGGGIAVTGASANRFTNLTIANNTGVATEGLRQFSGTITIGNTLVGDNPANAGIGIRMLPLQTEPTPNLFQSFAGFVPNPMVGVDVLNQDPLLAPLMNYGGANSTMALLPGSLAIDAGTGATGADQRGVAVVNAIKDIGAFESRGFTISKVAPTSTPPVFAPFDTLRSVVGTQFTFAAPIPANTLIVGLTGVGNEPVAGGKVSFAISTYLPTNATGTITDTMGVTQPSNVFTTDATGQVQFFAFANQFRTNANTFYTISATSKGAVNGMVAPNFNMENLGVATVRFTASPINTKSNENINSTPAGGVKVQTVDQYGDDVAVPNVVVTLNVTGGLNRFDSPTSPNVTGTTDNTGTATFTNLKIIRAATYQMHARAPQSIPAATLTPDATPPAPNQFFNITASKLIVSAVTTPVRSNAPFNVTVTAAGEDNVVDPNFTQQIALGINSFAATDTTGTTPAALTTTTNPKNAVAGVVTFNSTRLNRGGKYTLAATRTGLTTGVSNEIKVNANSIVFVSASAAGSAIFNPTTGGNVMPPRSVRSSTQTAIVDTNKDVLVATVVGRDVTGAGADIAADVSISVVSATQNRNGATVNIPAQSAMNPNGYKLDGTVKRNATGSQIVFGPGVANGNLTLNRWGDYQLRATANGSGLAVSNTLAAKVTVIARTISVVTPPVLVVGPIQLTTQAKDVTGDIAQNYNGPSDRTVLTINDVSGRGGVTTTLTGIPVRGQTNFTFNTTQPILVTIGAIDEFRYFIGSDGSITIETLDPGRRRPRPIPPVINLRVRLR